MSVVYSYADGKFHPITLEFGNHALGDEWHSFTGVIPAGGVPYLGQLVSRSLYADLWAYVQEKIPGKILSDSDWLAMQSSQSGNVPYYSSGDGSTTFRMPAVVAYPKGAASLDGAGVYTAEGLPNIYGTISGSATNSDIMDRSTASLSGCFTGGDGTVQLQQNMSTTGNALTHLSINASLSNPIYGNSNHVTPETVAVLFGVYAVSTIAPIGEADAASLLASVTTLESEMLGRSTVKAYIIETWGNGTDWYRKWSDGWIEQGGITSVIQDSWIAVNLLTPMMTTNYNLITQTIANGSVNGQFNNSGEVNTKTTSNFRLYTFNYKKEVYWHAYGF